MTDARKNVRIGYTVTLRWRDADDSFYDETTVALFPQEMNAVEVAVSAVEVAVSAAKRRGVDIARCSSLEVKPNGHEQWDAE